MGQQQLLLLVLGAIIVGLAIVVGINLFGEGAVKANEDSARQDLLTMMARAEEWFRKPVILGGGGKDFTTLNGFEDIGFDTTGTGYANENGTYTLTPGASPSIAVQLAEDESRTITYQISADANNRTTIDEVVASE